MRVVLAVLLIAFVGCEAFVPIKQNSTEFSQFMEFTHRYNKTYPSLKDFLIRYDIFLKNLNRVSELRLEHQRATKGAETGEEVYGITKFADLTFAEFKARYMGYRQHPAPRNVHVLTPPSVEMPSSVDWRKKGVITPVKNQAQCGSCWAFSAVEEVESMWAVEGNTLTELSVQQVVSCDQVDLGCSGGDTISAYQYIEKAGGLEPRKDYPYTSGGGDSGQCRVHKEKEIIGLNNHSYATPPCTGACNDQDEDKLAANMAATGPVSICVNANDAWQLYTGGVVRSGCAHAYSDLDHCVQLVGYDSTSDGVKYWTIRNSWATNWGLDGYIHIERGKNLCGVADEATFVHSVKAQ